MWPCCRVRCYVEASNRSASEIAPPVQHDVWKALFGLSCKFHVNGYSIEVNHSRPSWVGTPLHAAVQRHTVSGLRPGYIVAFSRHQCACVSTYQDTL